MSKWFFYLLFIFYSLVDTENTKLKFSSIKLSVSYSSFQSMLIFETYFLKLITNIFACPFYRYNIYAHKTYTLEIIYQFFHSTIRKSRKSSIPSHLALKNYIMGNSNLWKKLISEFFFSSELFVYFFAKFHKLLCKS